MNPNRTVSIDKVVVNIGVGEAGEKLSKGEQVLEIITGRKPSRTISKHTNRDFGIRKLMPLGCKVTLRGEKAQEILKDALWIRENRLPDYVFDRYGNFSFGIPDYTDFPNQKYDPNIGIFGMDINVSLRRNGFRVTRRRIKRSRIPERHRVTKDEGVQFISDTFGLEVVK